METLPEVKVFILKLMFFTSVPIFSVDLIGGESYTWVVAYR